MATFLLPAATREVISEWLHNNVPMHCNKEAVHKGKQAYCLTIFKRLCNESTDAGPQPTAIMTHENTEHQDDQLCTV